MAEKTPTGVITYGIVGIPDDFDPHNQAVPNDFGTRVAFDSLLMVNESGGLVPWLAESWAPVDPVTWDFRLRAGVRFASGRPLTAESIRWNFERLRANPRLIASARIPTYESAEVLDATTIRFRTRGPDAIWPRRVLQVVVADPEELGAHGFSSNAGSGLFRITHFDRGRLLVHESAGATWRGTARLAGLRMLPYDPQGLLDALKSEEADFGYLSGTAVAEAESAGLILQRIVQANVHMIRFNSMRAPFDDPRFREAVSLAMDQARIVDEEYLGEGRAPNQVVGDDCFGHDPGLPPLVVNVERARQLVGEVGHRGRLSFDILASSAVLRPWGEAAVKALRAVGVDVEPNFVDLPVYLGKLASNRPERGDFIGAGNQYGPGQDAEFSLNKFSNKLPPEQVEYSNPDFQALYDASQVEFDQVKRLDLLQRATRLLLEDHGCVPMYQPALSWLVSPKVQGLRFNTVGAGWIDWRDVTKNR